MEQKLLERINELAAKSKIGKLTQDELNEQATLRKQYIQEWRNGMTQTLDNLYIVEPDGTKRKVSKKDDNK